MKIKSIDHFVLTVASIEATCAFYKKTLGMKIEVFGEGRKALAFGRQKINLHEVGKEFDPKANKPTAGSGDFCLVAEGEIKNVVSHLKVCNVEIEDGPIKRTGAQGAITSVYFRDPDRNLVEVSTYS